MINTLIKEYPKESSSCASRLITAVLTARPEDGLKRLTKDHLSQLRPYLLQNSFDYIQTNSYPEKFGPLLRNFQSLSILCLFFFGKNLTGNDRESLQSYVERHVKNGQNQGIVSKQENIKRKTLEFVRQHSPDSADKVITEQRDYAELFSAARREKYRGMFTIRHWLTPPQKTPDSHQSSEQPYPKHIAHST